MLWHGSGVRVSSLSFASSMIFCFACAGSSDSKVETESPAPVAAASLTLRGSAEGPDLQLGQGLELLTCQWDRAADRGDYVWIRLATSAEAKGDGAPHLDLDICRLEIGGTGSYSLMPPGQHGSHCRPEPGFAVWWHEGEAAFVSPVVGKTAETPCELKLTREPDDWLSGEFSCDPLYSVTDAAAGPAVIAGSFRCLLEPMPPPK